MSIKATVTPGDAKTIKRFPKLMHSKGTKNIYYVVGGDSNSLSGVCLASEYGTEGKYGDCWAADSLVDFDGSVTLQNE